MPSYKLWYFNVGGLGEMIRLMFAQAGVAFEDCQRTTEEWSELKKKMPLGKMPVLYVDGEPIANSRAIVRYLAREFNFAGENSLTEAKIDVWVETVLEPFAKIPFTETDEKKKEKIIEDVVNNELRPTLSKLEELIASSEGPFAFGKNPTSIDFVLLGIIPVYKYFYKCPQENEFSRICKVMEALSECPRVAAWIAKRPKDHKF